MVSKWWHNARFWVNYLLKLVTLLLLVTLRHWFGSMIELRNYTTVKYVFDISVVNYKKKKILNEKHIMLASLTSDH